MVASSSYALDTGLPANVSAEKMILGAILLENHALGEAEEKLTPEDFSLDSHQRIYQRMTELGGNGHAIDVVTLANELKRYKEIESVGGVAYLSSLTEGLPRRPVIEEYIRIVKDKSLLRQIMLICSAGVARTSDQSETAGEVASALVSQMSALMDGAHHQAIVYSAAELVLHANQRLIEQPSSADKLPTGIQNVDEQSNGGQRLGELWVIGAAPSRGKTSLARQIVWFTISRGVPVYVHSGEMTKETWIDITACLIEGMKAWKVRDPFLLNLADKERLRSGLRKLESMPLFISDEGGIDLDRLIFNAIQAKVKHGIKLLVVDYAQIINARGENRRDQVSAVASRLREFAKQHDIATILLSQMARPEGRYINARPTMFGLKESGTLEESAHCVILPYLPIDPDTGLFTGEDELIFGKQRNGPVGSVPVKFLGEYLKFEPREVRN